jgi:hypothetical protein
MPRRSTAAKRQVRAPSLDAALDAPPRRAVPSIITTMSDPKLFAPYFKGASWGNWRTVLKAGDGLPMTPSEAEFFRSISGGREPPRCRMREQWWVVGRRGGKDSVASVLAAHTAALFDSAHLLRPGERALVLCLAGTRQQAQIILNYIRAYFENVPLLAAMVQGEMTKEGFSLNNSIDIRVGTNSFKGVRGHPILLAVLDEVAFWSEEDSARPPEELYAAVEPGLSSLESAGSRIIGISTPYRKTGLLYKKFEDHFGKDQDDVLVIRAPSRTMNTVSISQEYVDRAMARDRAKASAEYMAEFRDDIAGWLGIDVIQAAVDAGVTVRPPSPLQRYVAFVDPSGGRGDSFTCAIAHDDQGLAVLDCIIERKPPFDPMSVIAEMSQVLRQYRVTEVTGDRYGAEFNTSMFAACGINYRNSDRDRSAIYQDCGPLFNAGRVRLLDNRALVSQFACLERKPGPLGKDRVDHGPGGHDDICNSAAGALVNASAADRRPRLLFG